MAWARFPDCAPAPKWRTVGRQFPVNFVCFKIYLFFVMQIALVLLSPLWCHLPCCPGQLPQSPTPRSTTGSIRRLSGRLQCRHYFSDPVINRYGRVESHVSTKFVKLWGTGNKSKAYVGDVLPVWHLDAYVRSSRDKTFIDVTVDVKRWRRFPRIWRWHFMRKWINRLLSRPSRLLQARPNK